MSKSKRLLALTTTVALTAVCSAMRYIVDPPKSPLKRGTLLYCTLLQRKELYFFSKSCFCGDCAWYL